MPHPSITTIESTEDSALAALMTEAFSDYIAGAARMDATQLAHFLKAGAVDRGLSLVAHDSLRPVAVVLVGRSGKLWRIASMGIVHAHRGQGLGRALLQAVLARAREEGCEELHLEAFEQNTPAVALYRKLGFETLRRLNGWNCSRQIEQAEAPAECLDLQEITGAGNRPWLDFPALPWQSSPLGASLLPVPAPRIGTNDVSITVIGAAGTAPILRSIFLRHLGQRDALAPLLRALRTRHPDKQWTAPALWPEEFDPAFSQAGFAKAALSQLQMRLRP